MYGFGTRFALSKQVVTYGHYLHYLLPIVLSTCPNVMCIHDGSHSINGNEVQSETRHTRGEHEILSTSPTSGSDHDRRFSSQGIAGRSKC